MEWRFLGSVWGGFFFSFLAEEGLGWLGMAGPRIPRRVFFDRDGVLLIIPTLCMARLSGSTLLFRLCGVPV